jgi:hypothetical protein
MKPLGPLPNSNWWDFRVEVLSIRRRKRRTSLKAVVTHAVGALIRKHSFPVQELGNRPHCGVLRNPVVAEG